MPVLPMPDEYDRRLNGSFDEAVALQVRCFPDELIMMERTAEPWNKPRTAGAGAAPHSRPNRPQARVPAEQSAYLHPISLE